MCCDDDERIVYLQPEGMKKAPFSEAVRVGNMLYLSGQIGIDASGKPVPGGIAAETRQAMENIKATLERYGSSLDQSSRLPLCWRIWRNGQP
jgi:enamine deaminase RidA (YjgF/YER057c/UK114 family)